MASSKKETGEYPSGSGIKVHPIANGTKSSGQERQTFGTSYRVSIPARIASGKRRLRQFRTEDEARKFARDEWANLRALGEDFSQLTKDERREAVQAWKLAKKHGVGLLETVEFAVVRLCPEGGERTVREIVEEFVGIKEERQRKGDLKNRSVRDARSRALMLVTLFEDLPVNQLGGLALKQALLGLGRSFRTQRNYRSVWVEIMRFAKQRRYILDNPFDELSKEDFKEIAGSGDDWNPPEILTTDETERFIQTAFKHPELDLGAAVTLGLFCGVRTEELKQLQWKWIHLGDEEEEAQVTIPREIAKKRRLRTVPIPENAIEWLLRCPCRTGAVTKSEFENDYQRRFRKLLDLADFGDFEKGRWLSRWKRNAMRHSYGSYHFALENDSIRTSVNMGHKTGDEVLFEHYRSLVSKSAAERYFDIKPSG